MTVNCLRIHSLAFEVPTKEFECSCVFYNGNIYDIVIPFIFGAILTF